MRVVSVCSPCNDCGKTSLIEAVLRAFPGCWNVVKCTTIYSEEQFCPSDDRECACRHLDGDFCLIEDPEKIRQQDTDTGRFVQGGASSVYWGISRPGSHLRLWKLLTSAHLDPGLPVLIEGNTLSQELRPDLLLFVVDPELSAQRYKAGSAELAHRSDYLIFNHRAKSSMVSSQAQDSLLLKSELLRRAGLFGIRDAGRILVENVSQPLVQWRTDSLYNTLASMTHG